MARLNHYMAYMRIAVDENDDGRIRGSVYSQRLKEPIPFTDAADMLLRIENVLDEQDFPRAFQKKRTFGAAAKKAAQKGGEAVQDSEDEDDDGYMDQETVNRAKGRVSTFDVNVITRQNTSWQGYLDWLDESPKIAYNSVLELLSMIEAGLKQ